MLSHGRALKGAPTLEVVRPVAGLRVLHLVTRSHRRGAEVVAIELAAALDDLGSTNEVLAIALAQDGKAIADLPALVSSSRLGPLTYIRSCWHVRRHLAKHPADLVLAHGGWAAIVTAFAVPSSSVRVWQRILGLPIEGWGELRRRAWRTVARRFDGVVSLTSDMESEMRTLGYEGPVWLIANARDPERFSCVSRSEASSTLRNEIGIDAKAPLLGFVGHLVDQKQPELAVDVLAYVRHQGHNAHLVIAGDGPRRAVVERRIVELRLTESVTMLGHRDDPELIFAAADIALITSRAEGIPGVAIEAQMAGCPVVTFAVGAVGDVVRNGVSGVIIERPEACLMAKRISALLDDPATLHAMGQSASAMAAVFTTANSAAAYAARFAEMLAEVTEDAPPSRTPTAERAALLGR